MIQPEAWDEGLRATAERVQQETGLPVTFVLGEMPMQNRDGSVTEVRGVYTPERIFVQADNVRATADQLADHEIFHDKAFRTPGMVWELEQRIIEKYGREEFGKVVAVYAENLRGILALPEYATMDEIEAAYLVLYEEILADAYAGINAFSAHAEKFQEDTYQFMEEKGIGTGREAARATDRTTGPPEVRYSVEYDEGNRPFVTVEDDVLRGVPKKDWVSTVKRTLKNKFPNGVSVGNNRINIDKQTRQEMTFSEYTKWLHNNEKSTYADKLRAANNADEIILASRDYINEGLKHERKDDISDFARGTVQIRVGGKDYTAEVVVGTKRNGEMLLYDIVNLQQTEIKERNGHANPGTQKGPRRSGATVSGDSITQSGQEVNRENGETEGLSLPTLEDEGGGQEQARTPDIRYSVDDEGLGWDVNSQKRQEIQQEREAQELKARTVGKQEFKRQQRETARQVTEQAREQAKKRKPIAESKAIIAKKDLRQNLLSLFSIPEGRRAELGGVIDQTADRLMKNGTLTQADRDAFFQRMYDAGVMAVQAEDYYAEARNAVKGGKVYVSQKVKNEFGDDWNEFRKKAFSLGVYFTNNPRDSGIDSWNMELAEMMPPATALIKG